MKRFIVLLLAGMFFSGCFSPKSYLDKGDYHSAIKAYSLELRDQPANRKKKTDLQGLELAFNTAQQKDSAELAQLTAQHSAEHWPRINQLYRDIDERQEKTKTWKHLKSRKGYVPYFICFPNIDSLEAASRLEAAKHLYSRAQELLTSGLPAPAREAYHLLKDLKQHYYPYWENTNLLLDSAWAMGKEHVLFQTETQAGVSDGNTFWADMRSQPPTIKNDWLVVHKDSTIRKSFDYVLTCRLQSLHVGSDNTSESTRTETKEVEDGYDEVRDSSGRVVSRTTKYRKETTTITTYANSRDAHASVFMELRHLRTGEILVAESQQSNYHYSETSEISTPMSPSHWGMIRYVANNASWEIERRLKKALPLK